MASGAKWDHEWAEAQRRDRLSPRHVRMGRELGLNPSRLGKLANQRQEPWKAPLPEFIEPIYQERFKREGPLPLGRQRSQPETELSSGRAGPAG